MKDNPTPVIGRKEIASNLLQRLDDFEKRAGLTDSQVGQRALKDTKFIPRLRGGGNFNVTTLDKLNKWLDKNASAGAGAA